MLTRAYALSGSNLISFSTSSPTSGGITAIIGIAAGETLVGIDFRPQNGMLYGLGVNATANTATLYAISTLTGLATPVGGPASGISMTTDGMTPVDFPDPATAGYGFDFNPAADRIRVTTSTGLNFRINPNTGRVVDGDSGVAGINPDGPINGGTLGVDAVAYTNNNPNNGNVTTLYALDAASNKLFIQNPANAGIETAGITLTLGGNTLDFTSVGGFDIGPSVNAPSNGSPVPTGSATAVLNVGGTTALYSINLVNGVTTLIGTVLSGATPVQGLAVQDNVGGMPAIALTADGMNLVRFDTSSPGTTTTLALTNVTVGETIVGIDYRPFTGQLFAFGVNATNDSGSLYVIDPQTGAATVVGMAGQISFVSTNGVTIDLPSSSVGYGMDFDPVTDRIRITTGSGLNFRINPNNGVPVDGSVVSNGTNPDTFINGLPIGSSGVIGVAYTNGNREAVGANAVATTLYALDPVSNALFIQNTPNSGTETSKIVVTLNGNPLDFTAVGGFDIPGNVSGVIPNGPANGFGYAELTVGGTTSLYKIDLGSGAATNLGTIGAGTTSLAGLALGAPADFPVVRSDFDGSGTSDTIWVRDDGAVSVWNSTSLAGAHIIASAGSVPADWHIAGRGDFAGDGNNDILWQRDDGAVSIWDNGQMAGAHIIANAGAVSSAWHIAGTGDFDGNGRSDILWQNDNGAVSIWDDGGISNAHVIASAGAVASSWHIAGTGDFDGNGHDDILWRNDNGAVSIWDNGQIGGAHIVAGAGAIPTSWHIQGTGDFDGNGKQDILWRNDNGAVSIWDNGQVAGAHIIASAGVVGNDWHIESTGDFNGNGRSDILWQNDNGAVSIWENGQLAGAHIIASAGVVSSDWQIIG
ncbi:DUF4394 domain-containing protein [Bradyrhizobium sp. WSM 1704]|uniref:DUF4394 domain-containing protein n=1 Tax=Bradyrhizobium semiaridum TaxID=2821404 RepID=UPI001CE2F26B|nr:DUF4394 domain-containing protein [Bradyrhizobium semiaridum]MCA6126320.1 DUF4394 domain-containing protein [Bradyrhizobium semiaridum]